MKIIEKILEPVAKWLVLRYCKQSAWASYVRSYKITPDYSDTVGFIKIVELHDPNNDNGYFQVSVNGFLGRAEAVSYKFKKYDPDSASRTQALRDSLIAANKFILSQPQ